MATAKKAPKATTKRTVWRTDRISKDVDPDTGRHLVDLPSVKGLTADQRDALFAFEASAIGTTRAVIRMNKRHAGVDPDESGTQPYLIQKALDALEEGEEGDAIRAFYA